MENAQKSGGGVNYRGKEDPVTGNYIDRESVPRNKKAWAGYADKFQKKHLQGTGKSHFYCH